MVVASPAIFLKNPAHSKRHGGHSQASGTALREDVITGGLRHTWTVYQNVWRQLPQKETGSQRKQMAVYMARVTDL
jgi:hypothetical protein